jgi:hypothetical protein
VVLAFAAACGGLASSSAGDGGATDGSSSGSDSGSSSGSDSGSSSGSDSGSSSGSDSGSSSGSDSGSSSGSDASACSALASVPSNEIPPYVPVQPILDACSSPQITAGGGPASFIDSCLSNAATQATCADWQDASANATCATCLFRANDAGAPSSAGGLLFDYTGTNFLGANIAGCIAIADSSDGPACAASLAPLIECEIHACAGCSTEMQTQYEDCLSQSQMGACTIEYNNSASCVPDYADGGVGRTVCSTPEGALNVICGTGP